MTSNVRMALALGAAMFLALASRAQEAQETAEPETAGDQAERAPEAADSAPDAAVTPAAAEQPEAAGQEAPVEAGEEAAGEEAADGPVVLDEEEGSVLDDQTFEGEDDDFIPSEQIPIDQPIPFPTDI